MAFLSRLTATVARALPALLLLAACAGTPPRPSEPAPQPMPCPAELPAGAQCLAGRDSAGAQCLAGRDSAGAQYLIVTRAAWSGVLVLHAHGGPTLGPPRAERSLEDLQRWAVMPCMGHAWAGSTYRDGGAQVRAAAEDTERLRPIFLAHVGQPKVTVLHGQSWGASVAAVGAETYTARDADGRRPYDAVLLSSGVLAGGSRAYDFRRFCRVKEIWPWPSAVPSRSARRQAVEAIGIGRDQTLVAAQLSLLDHVRGFDAGDHLGRGAECLEAEHRPGSALDGLTARWSCSTTLFRYFD